MKCFLVTLYLFTILVSNAGTQYISTDTTAAIKPFSGVSMMREGGLFIASLLDKWERENPRQQIVAVNMHTSGTAGRVEGIWITYRTKTDEELAGKIVSEKRK